MRRGRIVQGDTGAEWWQEEVKEVACLSMREVKRVFGSW